MSIRVMSNVWERSKQSGSSLLLLLALADWCDDRGLCWPSYDKLAEKVRMSDRQTKRLVKQLETQGELIVKRRKNRSNLFILAERYTGGCQLVTPGGDTDDTLRGDIAMSPDPSLIRKRHATGIIKR